MKYYIDNIKKKDSEMVVSGWAVSDSPDVPVEIEIVGKKNGNVPFSRGKERASELPYHTGLYAPSAG